MTKHEQLDWLAANATPEDLRRLDARSWQAQNGGFTSSGAGTVNGMPFAEFDSLATNLTCEERRYVEVEQWFAQNPSHRGR